ncbi:hypothetical protein AB0C15_14910 [Micromonospora sp. NPDC048835]|uniref:hypothetical protein n=1 Tax=Micromonospora sp. NPDC048835 TaxID=3155147 RepID=UPI0033C51A33
MQTAIAAPREQVVVDVTGWASHHRDALMSAINDVVDVVVKVTEADDYNEDHGWTKAALTRLLSRLSVERGWVVAKAFEAAVANGGFVSRETVYELGGYDPSRQLKGFTRPIKRIAQLMRDRGEIASDAINPFYPDYDPNVAGYQPARGFIVPSTLVALYSE